MKFYFNWANGLWENYVLIYWWDHTMRDLFIVIVSLVLTYQVFKNNHFGFNSIKTVNFSKKNPF